jgi:hypothetical protein
MLVFSNTSSLKTPTPASQQLQLQLQQQGSNYVTFNNKKKKKKKALYNIRVKKQYNIPTKEVNKTNQKTLLQKVHPTSLKPLRSHQC